MFYSNHSGTSLRIDKVNTREESRAKRIATKQSLEPTLPVGLLLFNFINPHLILWFTQSFLSFNAKLILKIKSRFKRDKELEIECK